VSGYVIAGYLVTFSSLGAYALSLKVRARRRARRPTLDDDMAGR
jgi:hypothetical protein